MLPASVLRSDHSRARIALVAIFAIVALLSASPAAVAHGQLPQAQGVSGGGLIDRVLIRVNGSAVLYSDFEAQWLDRLSLIASQIPQDQIEAQTPMLRMQIMAALVEELLIEQRAEELGIGANANEIDSGIMRIREQNNLLDDNQWRTALVEAGLTDAMMRENIARSIVQQRMIFQEIQNQVFVSRREVESYYESHVDEFTEPEEVLFQQLIFAYSGADRAPIRERADNALTELNAGISLTAVGTKYAADLINDAASASWLAPTDLQPEIKAVVDELTPLTYSAVVEGRFGYHILQLMDRKSGSVLPIEQVGGEINSMLRDQKMGIKLQDYTGELVDKASLEIYADEFAELRAAWQVEGNLGAPTGTPGSGR